MKNVDYAAEMLKAIETNYGQQVQRIVKYRELGNSVLLLTIIFADYRMLEAKVKVETILGEPGITIEGTYY